jgi:hypothetical protein
MKEVRPSPPPKIKIGSKTLQNPPKTKEGRRQKEEASGRPWPVFCAVGAEKKLIGENQRKPEKTGEKGNGFPKIKNRLQIVPNSSKIGGGKHRTPNTQHRTSKWLRHRDGAGTRSPAVAGRRYV